MRNKTTASIILTLFAVVAMAGPALAGRTLYQSKGQTVYVPVYSHIYQGPKSRPYNLSALLSIRNVDYKQPITISSVRYYNSSGDLVQSYFDKPVTVPPMGTKEVYIMERDTKGGSGANFTVRWASENLVATPVIQAVMIGTASTQGISFVCEGVVIEEH
jgi:hypothetical protein